MTGITLGANAVGSYTPSDSISMNALALNDGVGVDRRVGGTHDLCVHAVEGFVVLTATSAQAEEQEQGDSCDAYADGEKNSCNRSRIAQEPCFCWGIVVVRSRICDNCREGRDRPISPSAKAERGNDWCSNQGLTILFGESNGDLPWKCRRREFGDSHY